MHGENKKQTNLTDSIIALKLPTKCNHVFACTCSKLLPLSCPWHGTGTKWALYKDEFSNWRDSPLVYVKWHWQLNVLSKQNDGDVINNFLISSFGKFLKADFYMYPQCGVTVVHCLVFGNVPSLWNPKSENN